MGNDTDKMMERFTELGVIPVVVLNDAENAVPLAKILYEEGLPVAEITFRTDAAEESICRMLDAYPDMLVGAGSVINADQVDRAVNAGAKFIVSPGFEPQMVEYCIKKGVPVCPGTQTPSEMMACLKLGLSYVKFFPAELSGGVKAITAITAALVNLKVMPTGGVNAENAEEYLKCNKVFCIGGSWMVKAKLIEEGNWETIRAKVRDTVNLVRKVRNEQQGNGR